MIARYRPQHPIIAFTPERPTLKTLCLVWGVYPVAVPAFHSTDAMLRDAQKKAQKLGFVKRGDLVAITAGLAASTSGHDEHDHGQADRVRETGVLEQWNNGVMRFKPHTHSVTPTLHFVARRRPVATLGRNGLEVGVTGGSFYG